MVRTVELDENKHFSKMMNSVKQMKHEEDLCDFTIKVDRMKLKAHKLILSAGSPYFKAMLKHDTIESREGMVSMKCVDLECVKSCIHFIYSGKLDIPDGKTRQLLHVAIMMQLDDAREKICNILVGELKPEIFYEAKDIAEFYDLKGVASKCKLFYQKNLIAISSQPGFQNEKKADILDLLKSKKFNLNEEEKMALSLRWVAAKTHPKEVLLEFFNRIKIHEVSSEYLNDLLENHPLVSNDLRLYKMLNAFFVQSLQKASRILAYDKNNAIVLFDNKSDSLRLFNPTTNEVAKVQVTKSQHIKSFNVVSVDSYIYMLGKNQSVYRLNLTYEKLEWERMQDMSADHGYCPPAVCLSGSIFVIASSSHLTKDVEVFNPFANNWTTLEGKPVTVRGPTLVSLDKSIYCIGGENQTDTVGAFCRFTPLSSEWADLEPMNNARFGCGAAAVDQRIFVMGGYRGSVWRRVAADDVECYDVTLGQWTLLSSMTESHGHSVAHHFNGWIFLIGLGESSDKMKKYDIANDRWLRVKLEDDDNFKVILSVAYQV